jgi:hypothetical protein
MELVQTLVVEKKYASCEALARKTKSVIIDVTVLLVTGVSAASAARWWSELLKK